MNSFLLAFLAGLVPAAIFAYPIYRGLLALKARQTVSQHVVEHAHKQGTPTMGGLMILAGLIPAVGYLISKGTFYSDGSVGNKGLLVLLGGYALVGFIDDFVVPRLMKGKRGLGWTQKLALQVGIAWLSVYMLGDRDVLTTLLGVFSILFFSNAFNFTDGLDWLASTVLVALAGGLAFLAHRYGADGLTLLSLTMIGATLPFMVFNRPPAKIFMGDVGSMPIGGLLGLGFAALLEPDLAPTLGAALYELDKDGSSLHVTFPHAQREQLLIPLLILSFVMIAELVPVPLQIASVKLRKKRLFPMTPIHHAFQKAGWRETRIVAMFFVVQVICSLIAMGIALSIPPGQNMTYEQRFHP